MGPGPGAGKAASIGTYVESLRCVGYVAWCCDHGLADSVALCMVLDRLHTSVGLPGPVGFVWPAAAAAVEFSLGR